MLIKTLLLSKLTFKAMVIGLPLTLVSKLKKLVFRFLWNGPDKVKRDAIYQDYNMGGLKMTNVEIMLKSLRLTWISRFLQNEDTPWKIYLEYELKRMGGYRLFFKCNFNVAKCEALNLSKFYSDLLHTWKEFRDHYKIQGNEIVWNNEHILVNGKPVFFRNFYEAGIITVEHLFPSASSLSAQTAFNLWVQKGLN